MDSLHEYAQHWFESKALRMERPLWLERSRQSVQDVVVARPGFDEKLRSVALDALNNDDLVLVRRALVALAIVGKDEDLVQLRALVDAADSGVAKHAKTAMFEIEHRPV